jgi:hypothetical protein
MNDTTIARAQATGYAWGQQDAGIGHGYDVFKWASHWAELSQQPNRPSIQDAWRAWMDGGPHARVTPTAGIADEVRDFLAKAIDDSLASDEYVDEDVLRGDR